MLGMNPGALISGFYYYYSLLFFLEKDFFRLFVDVDVCVRPCTHLQGKKNVETRKKKKKISFLMAHHAHIGLTMMRTERVRNTPPPNTFHLTQAERGPERCAAATTLPPTALFYTRPLFFFSGARPAARHMWGRRWPAAEPACLPPAGSPLA